MEEVIWQRYIHNVTLTFSKKKLFLSNIAIFVYKKEKQKGTKQSVCTKIDDVFFNLKY